MVRLNHTFIATIAVLMFSASAAAVDVGRSQDDGDETECICPKEGDWKVQNLKGWMNCTGPVEIKRSLSPVKDEGTIWILEEDCSRLFGEASRKRDEDILLERNEKCEYHGVINGEENGVNMVINVKWAFQDNKFLEGDMHSKPSLQGMFCEYYRPFEIEYGDEIPEKDYDKRRKKMLKKLEAIEQDG